MSKKTYYGDFFNEVIVQFMSSLMQIFVTGNSSTTKNENGDKIIAEDSGFSITNDGKWLFNLIPYSPFDTDMGGKTCKVSETVVAQCLCIISLVMNDGMIPQEIEFIIQVGDFAKMSAIKLTGSNFKTLLDTYLSLQLPPINVIVSAAKFKVGERKKLFEKFLIDGIPDDLRIKLRKLKSNISATNRRYSNGKLYPENIRSLTRIKGETA